MSSALLHITMVEKNTLAELESFLAEFRERPLEVRDAFLSRVEAFLESGIFQLNQTSAAGTGDVVLSLEFTKSFREFMAEARAGKIV